MNASTLVEQSEEMVIKIVSYLSEQGLRQPDFSVSDLNCTLTQNDDELFIKSVQWLEAEGVIRSIEEHRFMFGNGDETIVCGYSLTSRGFQLLSQKFAGSLTLGQAIANAKRTGKGLAGVGDLIGGVLGGFTKSMGSG